MAAWAWILAGIMVLIAVVLLVRMVLVRRRTVALRRRFGPEYDWVRRSENGRRAAEAELRARERRRARLDIRPLPKATHPRFMGEWRALQEHFVDQPSEAVIAAAALAGRVMDARGYPGGRPGELAALLSVDYPQVAGELRFADSIRDRAFAWETSTEELRAALLGYRSVFYKLLMTPEADGAAGNRATGDGAAGNGAAGNGAAGNGAAGNVLAGTAPANAAPPGAVAADAGDTSAGAARGGLPGLSFRWRHPRFRPTRTS